MVKHDKPSSFFLGKGKERQLHTLCFLLLLKYAIICIMGGIDMPDERNDMEKWRITIEPFLRSKLNEFHLLGLNHLKMDEFWQFVKESLEKKKTDKPERIHEVVAAVMALTVNDYMNKLRVDMFKNSSTDLDQSLFK
jgi:hypothetical protein